MNAKQDDDSLSAVTCKIKYWTANERQCLVPDTTISAFSYHEKTSKKSDSSRKVRSQYHIAKRNFAESRGETWLLPNKRTDRLADYVRELNSILSSNAILHIRWAKPHKIQLIFNSGLLVNMLLTPQHDIQRIFFDKSLTVKLPPEAGSITAATMSDKFCLLCYDEGNKIAYVSFIQRPETPELKRMTSKISSMDMKISFHDIPGDPTRRGCRKFCLNNTEDVVVCWSSSHLTSSSSSRDEKQERVNMVLLNCSFGKLEVTSYIHTDSNPVYVEFSQINQYQFGSLERTVTARNEVVVQYVTYECAHGRLQRLDINVIPVKSGVLSCSRNNDESKLAIGCTDGSIVVYDLFTKVSQTLRDHMVPSIVSWHPDGGVIMVASGSADLKCYDSALGELAVTSLDVLSEPLPGDTFKLSQYLPGDNGLVSFLWPAKTPTASGESRNATMSTKHNDRALVLFDGGPFALVSFHVGMNSNGLLQPIDVIREHIVNGKVKFAIEILHSLNWSRDPEKAFLALITIFNHLLKQPLSFDTEEMLERTLGSFYAPHHPIAEAVIIEHRHAMSRYARRFFHHLLEFGRLEKAFLLAKDIQDRDLFVDIYFNAKKCGETTVAKAAKQKMIELYSSSEEGSSSENEFLKRKVRDRAMRKKLSKKKLSNNIMKRKSNVTSPRMRKEIVPSSYPPPKMDDFMKSLINETKVLEMSEDQLNDTDEIVPKNIIQTGSTLKILDYGYV